jgi:hypothetical protein
MDAGRIGNEKDEDLLGFLLHSRSNPSSGRWALYLAGAEELGE